jgi:hypothetical protein
MGPISFENVEYLTAEIDAPKSSSILNEVLSIEMSNVGLVPCAPDAMGHMVADRI